MLCVLPCRVDAAAAVRFLAVGSYDNSVRILNLEDGSQMRAVATQMVNVSVPRAGGGAPCVCVGVLFPCWGGVSGGWGWGGAAGLQGQGIFTVGMQQAPADVESGIEESDKCRADAQPMPVERETASGSTRIG